MTRRGRRPSLPTAGLLALTFALTGCTSDGPAAPTTAGPTGITVTTTHEDVTFYPACGNEELVLDGTTWYQFSSEEKASLDTSRYPGHSAGSGHDPARPAASRVVGGGRLMPPAGAVLPAVAEPGPGDDVGTLTVYSDGIAWFVSDSGDLEAWLTTEVREHNFVC